ncbi:MAG: DEAD/DEAH box helicase [Gammaproteobacteria bacterium]|nr:DEAD/DEAH box helicase [Gammaproteobacteria bacterium]
MITNFCYFPLQHPWLDQLPEWLHYHALAGPIRADLQEVDGTPLLWDFWQQRVASQAADHPEVALVAAEFHLYYAEPEQAQQLLEGVDQGLATALRGWAAMALGNEEDALALLEQGLEPDLLFPLESGPLLLMRQMLYLQRGDSASLKRAVVVANQLERQLSAVSESLLDWPFGLSVGVMREVAQFLMGLVDLSQCPLLQRSRILSAWDRLFHALGRYWIGEGVAPAELELLKEDAAQAADVGIQLYVDEVERLFVQIEATARGIAPSGERGWAGMVHPKQPWEVALDAISGMAEQQDVVEKSQNLLRMAWRIEKQDALLPLLYPREQKLGKSGRWSKGRAIALKKLYQERDQFGYLSDQDHRICNTISERFAYSSASYQRKVIHELKLERALWELIGHPAVELEGGGAGISLEVVQQEPALEVVEVEEGESLRVQLAPYPHQQENGNYVVVGSHWEGGRRLVISRFEPPHLRVAQILGATGVTIPMAAKQRLLDSISAIAPLLTVHSAIGGGAAGVKQQPGDPIPHIHLLPEADGIRFSFWVAPLGAEGPRFYPGKGGSVVFGEVEGQQLQSHRDLQREQQRALEVLGGIEAAVPELLSGVEEEQLLDERLVEDPEEALELLFYLRDLTEEEVRLDWPRDAKIPRMSEIHLGQMKVGVQQNREWFALNGELEVSQGQVVALKELWGMMEHANGRFLKMEDGAILALSRELQKKLEALRSYGGVEGKMHPLALSAMDEALDGMQFSHGLDWEQQRDKIEEARYLEPELPTTLEADLRDYQLLGYQWMARLAHWGAGACLADDMGLGKTLQALSIILSRAAQGPALVLAPTSVCMNWQEEAARFAPTLRPTLFGEGGKEERQQLIEAVEGYDLVICSYGLLQREAELLQQVTWETIVVDEAQAIKNAATKRSQAVMGLQGNFRAVTTGTPIENHLGELWNLFRFINPGLLGSLDRFNERFARPIEVDKDEAAREQLKNLIAPFILRRLKRDVLAELPPRTEITLHVEMREEEAVFMEALRQRSIERIATMRQGGEGGPQHLQVLAEITRLRQACCHPKLVDENSGITSAKHRVFAEVVEELLDNGHRALVFSQFVSHLSLIREYLDKKGIRYQYLDGSTPMKKRKQAVDAFQSGEGELFLISLKAGGSGLNLTAADYVIHMDPWWNPAVEDQASDRAHRMGQTRPVTIYRLVVKGTIEEKIVDLHQHKRDLADQLLEGSDQSGKLSVDEMVALIQDGIG